MCEAPAEERAQEEKTENDSTFVQRVRQSTTHVGGRDFVLVTYHNIGMIDWATLFWGWLERSGIQSFMLLELDGLTCDASTALNISISFECVTGLDLMLPEEYTEIKNAGAVQEWGVLSLPRHFTHPPTDPSHPPPQEQQSPPPSPLLIRIH